jgi:geranylgeranyl diphosphate synthase, type II
LIIRTGYPIILNSMSELQAFFDDASKLVGSALEKLVRTESNASSKLTDAMRWSLFAGGKRFRPALLFAVGQVFNVPDDELIGTAAAVELIHTYSLIHDDLPSMDDDDLRRGRETCHKKFGEATAILAGDALQALAFQTIAEDEHLDPVVRIELLSGLGSAAACMVAGQFLDLEFEGRPVSLEQLDRIHNNKTGALIAFSARAAVIIAGAPQNEIDLVSRFGERVGLLFQIVDDILDVTQTTESLGKTAGKDESSSKATYPAILGLDGAYSRAESVYGDAMALLDQLERPTGRLADIAGFILRRNT